MRTSLLSGIALLIAAAALFVGACGGPPSVSVATAGDPRPTSIEIRGLPASDLRALASLPPEGWQKIFRVSVQGRSQEAMAGKYSVEADVARFTPMFGFDAGHSFSVAFAPSAIPGAAGESWRADPKALQFSVPGVDKPRQTIVRQVYPSASQIPENTLRFYLEFSAPMGRGDALPHITLVGEDGTVVEDPFLPVEAEFWSPDRTRFTLFFDPGRVKRGIKPNRELGRALIAGRRYALVIADTWIDGSGVPLKTAHRHEFTATAAIERPLDERRWQIGAPPAGSRDPLVVSFPWPLDHGLLQHALSIMRGSTRVEGEVTIEPGETRWRFTPRAPWDAGDYALDIAPQLEDPAGNRIGRAFEVMERVAEPTAPAQVTFVVK